MQFYTAVKQAKLYTMPPSFVEMYLKMATFLCFNQNNLPFLSVLSVVFTISLLVAVKRVGSLMIR